MITTLVYLLIIVLIVWVVLYILGMLNLPEPVGMVVKLIIALALLVYLLRFLGVYI